LRIPFFLLHSENGKLCFSQNLHKGSKQMSKIIPPEIKIHDGNILIYKRELSKIKLDAGETYEKQSWHYRFYVKSEKKYIRKTCSTTNEEKARSIAIEAFTIVRYKVNNDRPVFFKSFDEIYHDVFEIKEQKFNRHEITKKTFLQFKNCYNLYYKNHFKDLNDVSELTTRKVKAFWKHRINFWSSDEGKEQIANGMKRYVIHPKGTTLHID